MFSRARGVDAFQHRTHVPVVTEKVRRLMNAERFVPFLIKTSDGKQYRVKHPDYVAISPKGGRITVYADEEVSTMVTALHIVAVEPLVRRSRAR